MIDLHVHTWRCRHAEGSLEDYVRTAAERGISTLAFTEHLPLPPELLARVPGADSYAMPAHELAEYVSDVRAVASAARRLGVEVLLGVEADVVDSTVGHARELLARHEWDVVLASVHFIGDWAFDDPERTGTYRDWDTLELWERYFSELVEASACGLADVVAHADLVKKFGARPDGDISRLHALAAEAFASAGLAVEVNTAGLRKPCAELYPSGAFLSRLRRAGVPATIGSDAHSPAELGSGSTAAIEALREAGYSSVVVYRGRRPEEVGLDDL